MKIGFVGLSHLSLNYLVASAIKGFECIGFDRSLRAITEMKKNNISFHEPGLLNALKKNKKKINFTNNFKKLKNCDLVFIAKDIETNDQGKSNLKKLKKLINDTLKNLKSNSNLILLCQLPVGTTRYIKWKKENLYYQVETLIFGRALKRALKPERIIVGKNYDDQKISKNYLKFLKKFNCPLIEMSYESAELSKMSINMYLISTVTITNLLSEVSNSVGASWSSITRSLKLDKRIGKYAYLKPGFGITGGNLERDLFNIISLQKKNNLNLKVNKSLKEYSNERRGWINKKLNEILNIRKITKISLLGLAYKENTNSIKNSVSLNLIKKYKNIDFYAFDPAVKEVPKKIKNLKICKFAEETFDKADILIVATPWINFKKINYKLLIKNLKYKLIIDPYGILNVKKINNFKLIKFNK